VEDRAVNFWSEAELRRRMIAGWGNREGQPCGPGSTLTWTTAIRKWLPEMIEKHGINSICDAGAGALHWQKELFTPGSFYLPFDLIPRHPDVLPLDITKEDLPSCDAVLCRHVLIHFDPPRIIATLGRFSRVAKFLIASQYPKARPFNPALQYNQTDLTKWLGRPLDIVEDGGQDACHLAIWRLT
jgi:hypothetical protein